MLILQSTTNLDGTVLAQIDDLSWLDSVGNITEPDNLGAAPRVAFAPTSPPRQITVDYTPATPGPCGSCP